MPELKTKTPRDSQVESRFIVMPQHANPAGIAFGGVIMSWIDMVAAMVAQRHCEHEVVTASTDQISFRLRFTLGITSCSKPPPIMSDGPRWKWACA